MRLNVVFYCTRKPQNSNNEPHDSIKEVQVVLKFKFHLCLIEGLISEIVLEQVCVIEKQPETRNVI